MARTRKVNATIPLPAWDGSVVVESLTLLESPWGGGEEHVQENSNGGSDHIIAFAVPHSGELATLTISDSDPTYLTYTMPNGYDHTQYTLPLRASLTCSVNGISSTREMVVNYEDTFPRASQYAITNDQIPSVSGTVLLVLIEITPDTTEEDIANIRDTIMGLTDEFILFVGTYTGEYHEVSGPISDIGDYFDSLISLLPSRRTVGSLYPHCLLISVTNDYPCLLDLWETHLWGYQDHFKNVWVFTETQTFEVPHIANDTNVLGGFVYDPLYGIGNKITADGKTQVHFFSTRASDILSNDYYDDVWHGYMPHAALAVVDCEAGNNVFFNHPTRSMINGVADFRHVVLGYAVHLQHGLIYYDPSDFQVLTNEPIDNGIYSYYYSSGTLVYRAFRPAANIDVDAETFSVEVTDADGSTTAFDFAFGTR